jgi:hypothetical protein
MSSAADSRFFTHWNVLSSCRAAALCAVTMVLAAGTGWTSAGDESTAGAQAWPASPPVTAQPLLAQLKRLQEGLAFLGQPLASEITTRLAQLSAADPDKLVTAAVEELLDPLCVAAVAIDQNMQIARVTARGQPFELVEHGWRPLLIKILNPYHSTAGLQVESPNALPLVNSPPAEVGDRWLSLLPFTGQPMKPTLSGLPLEYLIVQFGSHEVGPKEAVLSFKLQGPRSPLHEEGGLIERWDFTTDAGNWTAEKNCQIETDDGLLRVEMQAGGALLKLPVKAPPGKYLLRFAGKIEGDGDGYLAWWTNEPQPADTTTSLAFPLEAEGDQPHELAFEALGHLNTLRLALGGAAGRASFDWIALSRDMRPGQERQQADVAFDVRPAIPVTFSVRDANGEPTIAGFTIRDPLGRVYPAQAKRLAPDFFFQPQIYRFDGESITLPAGTYTVTCQRGPESIPEIQKLVVGEEPAVVRYVVRRWIDPAQRGWWSGDHHIHAAGCLHYENPTQGVHPPDMLRHIMGEDLKIGCCLTWGPCFDYQKQFFTGKPDDVSRPPYILRYDIEVSGFGSHQSGHLNLLRLHEQIPAGGDSKHHWPTLGLNTLRWAKRQGAVCGPAHSGNGLTGFVGELEGRSSGPHDLPNYRIPAYDGIGANEFVMQVAHRVPGPDGQLVPALDFISTMDTDRVAEWNMWYHVLNCGFRVRASGETDFPCISGERVGMGRVYAKVDGPVDFDRWVQAIQEGRSYVSDGTVHLMDAKIQSGDQTLELGQDGSELRLPAPGKIRVTLVAAGRWLQPDGHPAPAGVPIELIVNGLPVSSMTIPADGSEQTIELEADLQQSSWVAVRTFPAAHTNPFFVLIDDRPIRASKDSVDWCLRGLEQCWKMKAPTYKGDEFAQAEQDYAAARSVYQQLLTEMQ